MGLKAPRQNEKYVVNAAMCNIFNDWVYCCYKTRYLDQLEEDSSDSDDEEKEGQKDKSEQEKEEQTKQREDKHKKKWSVALPCYLNRYVNNQPTYNL